MNFAVRTVQLSLIRNSLHFLRPWSHSVALPSRTLWMSGDSTPVRLGTDSDSRSMSVRVDNLPLPHDDPDTFGTMSIGNSGLAVTDEIGIAASSEVRNIASDVESIYTPEEADDHDFLPEHRWTMDRLRRTVFQLLRENNLKAALDTFTEVIQDGGFQIVQKDLSFICSALIYNCARAGHVEMAFKLFDDMKRRGAPIKEAWYTSLFNACANSPWDSERNLVRIEKVRANMSYKGYAPNQTHYHSMIKAYGRCGAIESAFSIVDEIRSSESEEQQFRITTETFNFLLQACISDRENGFRHAVTTWQKMMKMKIKPDVYSYKLFLRAIRECSIKIPMGMKTREKPMINKNSAATPVRSIPPEVINPSPGTLKNNVCVVELITMNEKDTVRVDSRDQFPVIQRTNSELQLLMNVPENRFAVLGGLRAFTIQLDIHKVQLDMPTATELAQNVSPAEIPDVLMLIKTKNLKPDIHFFNMLMKKYMRWRHVEKAKEIVALLGNYNLTPNIMTWGILALGANKWTDADKLLREMDALGMTPNEEILGGFLLNALRNYDPLYIVRLLEEHVRRDIKPAAYFVDRIVKFQEYVHKAMLDVECGREVRPFRLKTIVQTEEFNEYWIKLKLRFETWVKQVGVKEKEIPWKGDKKERMERLKNRKYESALDRT